MVSDSWVREGLINVASSDEQIELTVNLPDESPFLTQRENVLLVKRN